MIKFLDRALDSLHKSFGEVIKNLKGVTESIQVRISELHEALLEENEKRCGTLCDEVLEMGEELADEENTGEPQRKKMKLQTERLRGILNELCFPKFGEDFCEWFFARFLITHN